MEEDEKERGAVEGRKEGRRHLVKSKGTATFSLSANEGTIVSGGGGGGGGGGGAVAE